MRNGVKDLNLRQKSYPFDWVTKTDHLYDTNIMYNMSLIHELEKTDNVDDIVNKYIGNAPNNSNVNAANDIWFPHDTGSITDVFETYKRRFIRLKQDLHHCTFKSPNFGRFISGMATLPCAFEMRKGVNNKNIFILLTRH